MYRKMEEAGLPAPEYRAVGVYTLRNAEKSEMGSGKRAGAPPPVNEALYEKLVGFCTVPRSREEMLDLLWSIRSEKIPDELP